MHYHINIVAGFGQQRLISQFCHNITDVTAIINVFLQTGNLVIVTDHSGNGKVRASSAQKRPPQHTGATGEQHIHRPSTPKPSVKPAPDPINMSFLPLRSVLVDSNSCNAIGNEAAI